jgi:hypothetical protein
MGVGAFIAVSSTYGMVVMWRRRNRAEDVLLVLEHEAREVKEEEEPFKFLMEEKGDVTVLNPKEVSEVREVREVKEVPQRRAGGLRGGLWDSGR